jgi:tetratricopeptide (TPR) repeat protein
MKQIFYIPLLCVLLASCANPINRKNAENYHQWGLEAEWSGDFVLAERNFSRALANAQLGHSPNSGIAMVTYNLGRVKGYLCKNEEAEKLLINSLNLEEKVSPPQNGILTKRLFELARFYYDTGRYDQSVPYFARAIPMVKALGIEQSDPIALANAIDQYSDSLSKSGSGVNSTKYKQEANNLRSINKGKEAKFLPVKYGQCSV